jgi:DNA ligase (NAD+)
MKNDDMVLKYKTLCEKYKDLNRQYYDLDSPLVDDATYDVLVLEIREIEKKFPEIAGGSSILDRVGGAVSGKFSSVKHIPPMLSLSNAMDEGELMEFHSRCVRLLSEESMNYSAELKYDGLAIELIYRDGILVQGSTRGDGEFGEDVTENIRALSSLPQKLSGSNIPAYLSVRGEVYLAHAEFERINEERANQEEPVFSNPRNAAAGSIRQLDAEVVRKRNLSIVLYASGKIEGGSVSSQQELYERLRDWGLPVSPHAVFGGVDVVKKFYSGWFENRYTLGYDIDGIVVKLDDYSLREKMGITSKAPKWAIAWKFPAQEAVTELVSIEHSLGRTGVITPVANLKPINIGGVLVKRATLHNYKEIERLEVMIGDQVKIIRAGDVIPKIIETLKSHRSGKEVKIETPALCPSCSQQLKQEEIFLRCGNPQCVGKSYENLLFFVSKDGIDIEYFGPELVRRLYEKGAIKKPSDIFALKKEDLISLERMGDTLADKILASIEACRSIPLSRLLRALGIRNVGDHVARIISRHVGTIDNLYSKCSEDLQTIHEIGPGVADSVFDYFQNQDNRNMIGKMQEHGLRINPDDVISDESPFAGLTFVFTGSLALYTREEAESLVESLGAKASSSVSKKTNFLVIGENAGSKLEKAKTLGLKIITEKDFASMIKDGSIENFK